MTATLMSGREVAEYLGVSYATLKRYIERGTAPPCLIDGEGSANRWSRAMVDEWLAGGGRADGDGAE